MVCFVDDLLFACYVVGYCGGVFVTLRVLVLCFVWVFWFVYDSWVLDLGLLLFMVLSVGFCYECLVGY